MRDYAEAARAFDPAQAASAALHGHLEALNACVECCDRHAGDGKLALIHEDRDGNSARYSFDQLKHRRPALPMCSRRRAWVQGTGWRA